jgi:hypothetical protein
MIKDYELEVHYHPGKTNVVADALILSSSRTFEIFKMIFPSWNFVASRTKKIIGVHKAIPGYAYTVDKFSTTPPIS